MQTPCYLVQTEVDYKYIKAALHIFGYNMGMMSEKFHSNHNAVVLNLGSEFGLCGDINIKYTKDYNRYLVKSLKEFIIDARKLKEPKTNSNNILTNMKTPVIKINANNINKITSILESFGYEGSIIDNFYQYNYLVLDLNNRFGKYGNVESHRINKNRYIVNSIEDFISEAAKLKGLEYREEIMKKPVENNAIQKPKTGDHVFVRNKYDSEFESRIYIGKYKNKYICVHPFEEKEFKETKKCNVEFWDELSTKITLTKKQIAEKFGVSVDRIEITD